MTDIIYDYRAIAGLMLGEHRPKPKPIPDIAEAVLKAFPPLCLTCGDRGAVPDFATGRSKDCPDCVPTR